MLCTIEDGTYIVWYGTYLGDVRAVHPHILREIMSKSPRTLEYFKKFGANHIIESRIVEHPICTLPPPHKFNVKKKNVFIILAK